MFFYDQPGWSSATGTVELWTGEKASEANRANRERLLTEAGHATIGLVLAAHEDTTIVLTPTKWLSWSVAKTLEAVTETGADLEAYPPDTWWRELG